MITCRHSRAAARCVVLLCGTAAELTFSCAPGSWAQREHCARLNHSDGFYPHDGGHWRWHQVQTKPKLDEEWQWTAPPHSVPAKSGCALERADGRAPLACASVAALRRAQCVPPTRPYSLLLVGDSISGGFYQDVASLLKTWPPANLRYEGTSLVFCEQADAPADGAFELRRVVRADTLVDHGWDDPASGWVAQACRADMVWINTGAHFDGVAGFERVIVKVFGHLNGTCGADFGPGGRRRLLYWLTPEGNPLCQSKDPARLVLHDMGEWQARVGRVIRGEIAPSADAEYDAGWHWDKFPLHNARAAALLPALLPGAEVVDVVPLSRLRPVVGWKRRSPDKPLDCLHGSPAVREWPVLLLNHAVASACRRAALCRGDARAGTGGLSNASTAAT